MRIWLLALLSLGHAMADLVGGGLPLLLLALKDEFGLTYTALSVVVLVSNLSASVIQPLFGVWSDKHSLRWLLPAGCLLSALGMALAGVAPTFPLILVGVALNGIGASAYHPEASKQAFLISGEKKATALSIFSVGGNIGFGLGPIVAAFLLGLAGRKGMVGLLLPAAVIAFLLYWYLPALRQLAGRNTATAAAESTVSSSEEERPQGAVALSLFLLIMIVIIRSLIHMGLTTFIPLYVVDYLKGDQTFASILLTVFLLAGAVGTLFGGPIADRWGRKKMIVLSFLLVIPSLWLFIYSSGVWSIVLAAWNGFILISTFAVTVVHAQEMIPHHVGLASGLLLGFAVGMGAVGSLLFGVAADAWGIPAVLKIISVLPVPAFLLALALPGDRKVRQEAA